MLGSSEGNKGGVGTSTSLESRRRRVLLYSHDTYGLGHLRRCLLIARGLAEGSRAPAILIATGSPRASSFPLPPRCGVVQLAPVTKTPQGTYRAREAGVSLDEVVRSRSRVLRDTARKFAPDLILIDHAPCGMEGELAPLFEDLYQLLHRTRASSSHPQLVLGLRDVIDSEDRVLEEWHRLGIFKYLDTLYDKILVYGDPRVTTTAQELGLHRLFADKLAFVGYLGKDSPRPATRPALPSILVTTGGGGDGDALLSAYADFLERLPSPAGFHSWVVTGPLLTRSKRRAIMARLKAVPHSVTVSDFTPRLEELIRSASGVVSMAGYNTVMELLSARVPALLVPRESPRLEQLIRARRLARHTHLEMSRTCECGPQRIEAFVRRALNNTSRLRVSLDMNGIARTVAELETLLRANEEQLEGVATLAASSG